MKKIIADRKGQSLVLFVLLLPILLGIMALVIDVGNALVEKNKLNNTIEIILEIAIEDKLEMTDIQNLINNNLKENINIVTINGKIITINSKETTKGIFSKILNINGFKIESEYTGELKNNKVIITKKK